MKKTIREALIDEVLYPVSEGYVDNVIIKRGLDADGDFTIDVDNSSSYKGAVADCLYSLIQAVDFSEADKSVGNLTDEQRKQILKKVNALYGEIGEPLVESGEPKVIFGYGKKRRKRKCRS